MTTNMELLAHHVEHWAKDRGLDNPDNSTAQAEADAGIIKAEGEAKANKAKSDSITDNLIRMKEAEAREKHGWVTVNGAGSVITNKE